VTESREAAERHRRLPWDRLPDHLGLAVTQGEVPERIDDAEHPTRWIDVAPDRALVRLVGGNRVLVSGGTAVRVHVPDEVRHTGDSGWLVQGWAVSLAMLQRGHLVLHGATAEVDGGGVCVVGRSGAGKSTTAVGLRQRGHRLLVDDVSAVVGLDPPRVLPYLRGAHLTRAATEGLGLDFETLPELSSGRGKVAFVAEDPGAEPVALAAVAVVVPDPAVEQVEVTVMARADRLRALDEHARREGAAPAVLGMPRYFDLLTRLADRVPVVELRRPAVGWSLDAVLDAVERIARGKA